MGDGYTGEYVKIILTNGKVLECPINGRIDGDEAEGPARDIICEVPPPNVYMSIGNFAKL